MPKNGHGDQRLVFSGWKSSVLRHGDDSNTPKCLHLYGWVFESEELWVIFQVDDDFSTSTSKSCHHQEYPSHADVTMISISPRRQSNPVQNTTQRYEPHDSQAHPHTLDIEADCSECDGENYQKGIEYDDVARQTPTKT